MTNEDESPITNNAQDPTSKEIQLWFNMMKFMLECAEISMFSIRNNEFNFSEEELKKCNDLFALLKQVKQQLTPLDQKSSSDPPCICPVESSTQSQPVKKEDFGTQIENQSKSKKSRKKRRSKRDACFCDRFTDKIIQESAEYETIVCSTLNRTRLLNESCKGCSALGKQPSEPATILEDEEKYIIKSKGTIDFQGNGIGYELFYRMSKYADLIAQHIEETNESITYAVLCRESISVAVKLRKKGINEESVICLCITNGRYTSLPYIAGLFVGAKMNALDPSFKVSDIAFLMKMVTPSILFVDSKKIPEVQEALTQEGLVVEIVAMQEPVPEYECFDTYLQATDEEIQNFKPYKVDTIERICIILFSSGTSGLPKGICLSHRNMENQMVTWATTGFFAKCFMSFTSFYWITATLFLLSCCLTGVEKVVPKPFEASRFYELVQRYKVTGVLLGPFDFIMLAKSPGPEVDVSSLICLSTGGGPVKPFFLLELQRKLPDCFVTLAYGMTEVGGALTRFAANNQEEVALCRKRINSCGMGFGGIWYKIVDEDTGRTLGPYQSGQLCIKSDNLLMKGYYNREWNECFDENGWLSTGDMAHYDEYQCIYIVDRMKELIKYRGWHITPILLEHLLISHPAVARAAVIGIPHEEDGEHAMGLIVLNPSVDPSTVDLEEIAEFVNEQVDEMKKIRAGVRIIESIPVTATGKVRRMFLRDTVLRDMNML